MLSKLITTATNFKSFVFENSNSVYELVLKAIEKLNEIVDYVNGFQSQIDSKESSSNLTNKRKLSEKGDFTGTLSGVKLPKMFMDIKDSLSLCKTLIDMVNHRESIGTIYDGGTFTETTPPTITIEGGLF